MDIKLDLHTHTLASGHGYSTIQEMAREAACRGLEYLGITEHAPSLPGACHEIYFRNLHVVPREMYGVKLLLGTELNILDITGRVDLDESYYRLLDLRIAGIHSLCWQGGSKDENTQAMINAISNPWVQIISHPCDGTADIDLEAVAMAARDCGTLLEINNSSLLPIRHKDVARPNNLRLLEICKRLDMPVILGSDAHISFSIADYDLLWPLLREVDFPSELIVNYSPQLLFSILKQN